MVRQERAVLLDAVGRGVLTALVVLLAGAPVGLLWSLLAPELDLPAVASGSQSAFRTHLTDDLVFGALAVLAGLGTAVVALLSGRLVRPGTEVGLVVGGLLAAVAAGRTGRLVRLPELLEVLVPGTSAAQRDVLEFQLRVDAFLLAWPVLTACALVALRQRAVEAEPAAAAAPRYGEAGA